MSRDTPPGGFRPPDKTESLAVDTGWSTVPPAAAPDSISRVQRLPSKARADGTLLGVAPPQPDAPAASAARSPVVVYSGVASVETARVPAGDMPKAALREPNDVDALPIPVAPQARRAPPELPAPTSVPESTLDVSPAPERAKQRELNGPELPQAFRPPVAPGAMPPRREAEPASVGAALTSRVRFAGGARPLWQLLACGGLLLVGVAVGAVTLASRSDRGRAVAGQSLPPAVPSPAEPAGAPLAPQPTLDTSALEAKPPGSLSAEEVLAVAASAAQKEREGAKRFRERLARDPSALKDKAAMAQLRQLTADPDTAPDALAAVAGLPGPLSADLLYEIWTATPNRTDTTELARALVYSRDVRAKASAALGVALELRVAAESCEASSALLPRALEAGDRRSVVLLAKLKRKQGCGANKKQDCFACLREGGDLDAAIKAVTARRAPNPFQ